MTECRQPVSMVQEFIGKVVSNRMKNSILVAVDRWHMNSKYKMKVKRTSKLMAHDEGNQCNVGDRVKITSCRPLSKRKAFMLTDIVHRENIYDAKAALATTERANLPDVVAARGFAASALP